MTPPLRISVLFSATLLALGAEGCTGHISDAGGPPPPPDTEAQQVPLSPTPIESSGFCTDLLAGERVVSVSAEGQLWLAREENGESLLRVVDSFDAAHEVVAKIALSGIERIQAWSQVDAAVTTASGLWKLEDLSRVELTPPAGFSKDAAVCGDPTTNGSLLFAGRLFERRDDEQWWAWDTGAKGAAAPSELLLQQGECQGPDDVQWMTSPDGTLWRVEPTTYYRPVQFPALKAAAVTTAADKSALLAAIDGEELWVGPETWQRWQFPNGAPGQLSAAGGMVWVTSGSQLLGYDGESWSEMQRLDGEDGEVASLHAHDGGLWVEHGSSVCHLTGAPMVHVAGVRPYLRTKELDHAFSITASDEAATVTASLDGEPLTLTIDPETGASTGSLRLDSAGWHQLVAAAGAAERRVWLKRLPDAERSWDSDIRPIFESNCAGCHTTGQEPGGPALASYQDWVAHAKQIQQRVVDAKTMPPAANKGPDWGDDDVQVIAQWLAGGMAP